MTRPWHRLYSASTTIQYLLIVRTLVYLYYALNSLLSPPACGGSPYQRPGALSKGHRDLREDFRVLASDLTSSQGAGIPCERPGYAARDLAFLPKVLTVPARILAT